ALAEAALDLGDRRIKGLFSIHLISFDEAQRGIRHGKVSVISQGSSESQFRSSARTLVREVHSAFASAWVAGEVRAAEKNCTRFVLCSQYVLFLSPPPEKLRGRSNERPRLLVCCCARDHQRQQRAHQQPRSGRHTHVRPSPHRGPTV